MRKIRKRLWSFLLTFIMVFSMIPAMTAWGAGMTPTQPANGDGSSSNPYQISTAAELYWFAGLVNGTLTDGTAQNLSACAILTDDIIVNENVLAEDGEPNTADFIAWTPIAYTGTSSSIYYKGTFDGNGKVISGLYLDKYVTSSDSASKGIGLFGKIQKPAVIKNVTVADSYLSGYEHVGGIVGYYMSGTVQDCVNKATIKGFQKVGGVTAGSNNAITLTGCRNEGLVKGGNIVGGLAGYVNYASKIQNCSNTGDVVWVSDTRGILGGFIGDMSGTTVVENCYSTGDVILNENTYSFSDSYGGFIGSIGSKTEVKNCYYSGSLQFQKTNSKNIIGIFAGSYYGKITDCYYNNTDTTFGAIGYTSTSASESVLTGKNTEEFASGEVTWLLNGETSEGELIWGQDLKTEATPVFGGKVVYYDGTKYYNEGVEEPEPPVETGFVDVKSDDYFADAVLWAKDNGITNGLTATVFGSEAACTRADAVTFLWRAAGKPEVTDGECEFTDISNGEYYYDAVLWAVENGITVGTTETTFSPDDACTRAQIVSFLWRAAGEPDAAEGCSFLDVTSNQYYYDAVCWAAENDIVEGYNSGHFAPHSTCTRAEIVTFLYRYYN